ncbi:Ribonuclease H2, subunit C [Kalmanozyma brasiliensis GHG001]|uniref:Ribonuclease H2, subunit C n=1 Tax=Kalmanozyma brasiliensis (strain GHG001) TaxID=1365824 RepID=UPI002867DACC|nr:Ribonuclease H2, subunit C [Kalmanozyma brasiliensis GHG001]KAF6767222.1 Ribonuclease H2, subunit C [Kalmanozyma brasiliensis GHG001]
MTSEAVHILPPPISITFGTADLPQCSANLMPFHIDYDGPAPVDSFLVRRSASDEEESFISAFRGRAVQSTPLPLPHGFVAKVVEVSQVAGSSSGSSRGAAADSEAAQHRAEEDRERERKRRRIAHQAPAQQQKFSMDSDEEDEDEGQSPAEDEYEPAPPQEEAERAPAAVELTEQKASEGPTIHIEPIAQVASDQLTIWGPDGPIDKGDDTFFRTIGEWYSVVAPLLHG